MGRDYRPVPPVSSIKSNTPSPSPIYFLAVFADLCSFILSLRLSACSKRDHLRRLLRPHDPGRLGVLHARFSDSTGSGKHLARATGPTSDRSLRGSIRRHRLFCVGGENQHPLPAHRAGCHQRRKRLVRWRERERRLPVPHRRAALPTAAPLACPWSWACRACFLHGPSHRDPTH